MHLIVCVDDRYGMSFCGRRLSRDRAVSTHILNLTSGNTLWMHPSSKLLFPESDVKTDPAFLDKAAEGDYCFAETITLPPAMENLESVILYHWNRAYPATIKFPRELLKDMHLAHSEDFPGNSHDTITMERYTL